MLMAILADVRSPSLTGNVFNPISLSPCSSAISLINSLTNVKQKASKAGSTIFSNSLKRLPEKRKVIAMMKETAKFPNNIVPFNQQLYARIKGRAMPTEIIIVGLEVALAITIPSTLRTIYKLSANFGVKCPATNGRFFLLILSISKSR